jgi:hypothetical protein
VNKIVVMCRMPHAGAHARGKRYLERARALTRRAEALGAELVAWGAASVAFAWDPELVEEAIALAVGVRDATGDAAWSCGVSEGEMEPLGEGASRATLAWGDALLLAFSLARVAAPGEVVVDDTMTAAPRFRVGAARVGREVGIEVRGHVLDGENPWRSPADAVSLPMVDGDPEAVAEKMLELVQNALRTGDARALERWSAGLKATGEHDALAERMHALARLSRGKVNDAIRSLERVRSHAQGTSDVAQCQSSLALGVALLAAGRPDEALLEALDALAHARAAEDLRSAGACLAFLAKLFARVGRRTDAERIAAELTKYPRGSIPGIPAVG